MSHASGYLDAEHLKRPGPAIVRPGEKAQANQGESDNSGGKRGDGYPEQPGQQPASHGNVLQCYKEFFNSPHSRDPYCEPTSARDAAPNGDGDSLCKVKG